MERNSESRDSEDGWDLGKTVLFGGLPDPAVFVDAGGGVVAANDAATELAGSDGDAIVGSDVDDVFLEDSDRLRELVERASESEAASGDGVQSRLEVTDAEGRARWFEARARWLDVGSRGGVCVVLRELDHQEHPQRILERLQRATDRLAGAGSREEVAAVTAAVAEEALGVSLYRIMLYDPGRDALVETATSGAVDERLDHVGAVERPEGIVWKAFERDEVLVYDDVRDDPDVYAPETEVRSEVVVPLGEYGVLVASSTEADAFDAADVSLAKTVGTSAEAALTRMDRERRLRNQTHKLRTIIDNAPIVLFGFDEDGVFTASKGKALERMGVEPGTAVGESVFELYEEYDGICEDVRRALDGEAVDRTREVGGRVYETWYRPVEAPETPVSTPEETVPETSVIGAAIDVSERERRERLVRVLNRFLRHNLRNAMNVVVGYAQRIDGHPDAEVQTAVDRIAETGADLTRLSEKARRLSEMAATEHEVGTVELRQCVGRVVADLEDRYDVDVSVRGTERELLRVPETVELAIGEICENAVKHPEDPAPTVSVTSRERASVAVVDVLDEGPGLPDQEQAMLESEGETPLKHGSGLGLFVAYWAVSDAGGEVDVRKADDEGTGITITVPIVSG